ncbi:MAG TPA: LamG-like jellyroll fold domain-containing protein, partial [Sumerlaeia bacterium]|nr:LamG-like jellyroll fold domain-containing protein [Sumerlaeia bacterium]
FNDGFLLDTFPGRSLRLITPRGSASYDAQLPVGEWTHVAATYDPEGDIRLFVAGKRVTAQKIETRLPGEELGDVAPRVERLRSFHDALGRAGLGDTYEAAHARLVMECVDAAAQRAEMLKRGGFPELPPRSRRAADVSYVDTVRAHCDGLEKTLDSYEGSEDPRKRRVFELWKGRR